MEVSKDEAKKDRPRESELGPYLRLMRVWGLWPYEPSGRAKTTAYWLYIRFMLFCQLVVSVQQVLQMTMHQDLNNISSAVDTATISITAIYRQVRFTTYADGFKRIADNVDANFLPQSMPHRFKFDMKIWVKRSKMYAYVYLTLAALAIAVWVISRNIDNIIYADELKAVSTTALQEAARNFAMAEPSVSNTTSTNGIRVASHNGFAKRRLPFNCWYPFDSGESPAFEIAFLWETSMFLYSTMVYIISDVFLYMVIYLTCGQLEILKTSLRLLHEDYRNNNKKICDKDTTMSEDIDREVIKCVEYHCNITNMIGELDRCLRSIIVADFLHAVISLSFAMLQTIISKAFYEWVQMLMFIGVCVLHQFLNNLFAEILIQQQEAVAEAVYEAPWVEGSDTLRATVTMTTAQARSPTRLSGWKMYVLGNSTFVEFMKLMFSYFLVLQSLHAKEKQGQA